MRNILTLLVICLFFAVAFAQEAPPPEPPAAAPEKEQNEKKDDQQEQEATPEPEPPPQYDGGRVYLKIGGALLFDDRRIVPEPAFGFGYRYEDGMLAVDLSFFNESIGPTVNYKNYTADDPYERNKLRITLSRWANLSFYWIAQPDSWQSFYGGGGVAVETLDLELFDDISSQTGISVTLTAGWELFRGRAVILFGQLEATLPCFAGHFEGDTFWVPSLLLLIGAGF